MQPRAELGDDALVGLSRVIGQDVNIFSGARLQATSERDLFASGLLPTRTPADVYRGIVLDRMPTVITEEQAAGFRYMVAAAPLRPTDRDAILTVPLTLRQQEIEREIDDLNRRIVLAALLFILIGAAIGYPMAERIADPVNRLTRATRRIARGDLDARVADHVVGRVPPAGRRVQPHVGRAAAPAPANSSAPTGSRRGPRWRARWRTTSRTR